MRILRGAAAQARSSGVCCRSPAVPHAFLEGNIDNPPWVSPLNYLVSALPEAARKHLEELMAVGTYEYKSDFARKYQAEGKIEGKAEAILKILARRKLVVSEQARERILACHDPDLADAWIDRAFDVTTVDELFD
ncbi:hypothetical protein [Nonomuraea sp. NPDC003754]